MKTRGWEKRGYEKNEDEVKTREGEKRGHETRGSEENDDEVKKRGGEKRGHETRGSKKNEDEAKTRERKARKGHSYTENPPREAGTDQTMKRGSKPNARCLLSVRPQGMCPFVVAS